jgi:hypothetical protein
LDQQGPPPASKEGDLGELIRQYTWLSDNANYYVPLDDPAIECGPYQAWMGAAGTRFVTTGETRYQFDFRLTSLGKGQRSQHTFDCIL